MNTYKATVIKSGNSYALRVPKAYANDQDLQLGEKVELSPVKKLTKKQDRAAIQKAFRELQEMDAFKLIKDPVAWQRDIRKDRPLPGRS